MRAWFRERRDAVIDAVVSVPVTALVGVCGVGIGLAVWHALAAGAAWAWAVAGLVVGLAVGASAATATRLWRRQPPDKGTDVPPDLRRARRDSDAALLTAIIELIPAEAVTFLKEHDFGGDWRWSQTQPWWRLGEFAGDIAHRFLDPELEACRSAFAAVLQDFLDTLAVNSGPIEGQRGVQDDPGHDVMPRSARVDHPAEYERRREAINGSADAVASAYEGLVGLARSRLAVFVDRRAPTVPMTG